MEEDNYGFKKIMLLFSILGIIMIIAVMWVSYTDESINHPSATYPEGFPPNDGESFAVVVGPTPTLIYSDTDENGVYTSSPNKDDVDKIQYKVVIDGVESIVTLNSNRQTDDVWIINKTVVGNDKENVTLVEYMRDDGTTYEMVE